MAGHGLLIIEGRAAKPVYLSIRNEWDKLKILSAFEGG